MEGRWGDEVVTGDEELSERRGRLVLGGSMGPAEMGHGRCQREATSVASALGASVASAHLPAGTAYGPAALRTRLPGTRQQVVPQLAS